MTNDQESRPLGAGEGGRLPKGLSLFRFFLFSGLMLGAAYGGAALYFGSPPPPGYVPPRGAPAREWSPSALWLPVFATVHAGLGIAQTPDGFAYRGALGRAMFGGSAMLVGVLLGGILGWTVGEQARRRVLRRSQSGGPAVTAGP